jgi:zinc/manganese transport system ATP-binding protein
MSFEGISLKNLTLSYQRHPAVHHLTGTFAKGTMTAIMGPNGGGKSTLIKALAGLHPIDEGSIVRTSALSLADTAYLPQSLIWDRQFPVSVLDLVHQALLPELGLLGRPTNEHKQRVDCALEQVGLLERRHECLGNLSLGQFQRALFARVIVQNAQVILLDEPLTGLDEKSIDAFFTLMHTWKKQGKTLIVVLHDRHLALEHFQTTLILAREAQAWGSSRDVLDPQFWSKTLLQSPRPEGEEECVL